MALVARAGIIGDIHAEDERLAAAIAFLEAAGVSTILATGDIVDGPGDVDRYCALLDRCGALAVRGNHDRWLLGDTMRTLSDAHHLAALSDESRRFLQALPTTRTIDTVAGPLLLCDGVAENDMRRLTPDDFGYELECNDELQALMIRRDLRFMVGGHTHRRMARRFGEIVVLNPGTLRRTDDPCVLMVDFALREIAFHDFDTDARLGDGQRIALP